MFFVFPHYGMLGFFVFKSEIKFKLLLSPTENTAPEAS